MIFCANSASQDDESCGDGVSDPNTKPRLPPSQSRVDDAGRRDHPGVDVERVSDPECDLVVVSTVRVRLNVLDCCPTEWKSRI